MTDFEKAAFSLGKVYGLAEKALPNVFGNAEKMGQMSDSPLHEISEVMRLLIANHALTDDLDKDFALLLDEVPEDFPEHPGDSEKSMWWLGYWKTKPREYDNGLEAMRKKAKLTQAQLAEKIGVDQRSISRWELGTVQPGANFLSKIAEALRCKVDDLI